MGSGAGVLRQDFGAHRSIEYHIRLPPPGRPVIVITISRIPEIEIEELDRALIGVPNDEPLDYDYDTEDDSEVEEWVRVTRF